MNKNAATIAQDLRKNDHDRYLLSLFAPARIRGPLQALYAFNHEIAKTRSMVTDTNLGLIRLQWWRDEIDKIYKGGDGGQIPILSTMAPRIHQQDIPQALFDTLIYAREFDLEDVAPETLDGLLNYANFTTTPLNEISLKMVGETASEEEIKHISTNFGLLGVMRNVPFTLSEGRCYLPQDVLRDKNLSSEKVISFNHKTDVVDMIKWIFVTFDSYRKPDSGYLALQQRMTFIYLKHLKKYAFNVFLPETQMPPPFMAMRLALSWR